MALVRVCDRCESDESAVLQCHISYSTQNIIPRKEVDLCSQCRMKLDKFLDGFLLADLDEGESEVSKRKKDKLNEHEADCSCINCRHSR
jgi:hypothetical protein